jgi:hypothetical protein
MAKHKDTMNFTLRYTTTNNLISTVLEKFRILPKIGSDLLEEMVFSLLRPIRRDLTCSEIINYVSIPRYFLRLDLKQLLIRKGIMNWNERGLKKYRRKMVSYNIIISFRIPYL